MEESQHGCLYISNLPFKITEKELQEIFGGPDSCLIRIDLPRNYKGDSKGFAVLEYSKLEKAQNVMNNYQGYQLYGRVLFIRWDTINSLMDQPYNNNLDKNNIMNLKFPFDQYPEDSIPPSDRDWERCYYHDIQFAQNQFLRH